MKQFGLGGFAAMRCEDINGTQIVTVGGEVDLATAPRLRDLISRAMGEAGSDPPRVVVDLLAVEFIDTAGLEVLLEKWSMLRRLAGNLRLVACEGPVTRLLEVTGLEGAFDGDLYMDLGAAVRSPVPV
ncbi:MAG TPA: STAS domain-containing protein [Rubrobacteraceae bacterium]|nr:STAS domain-containing protein [Rubrobacteraceae bacterium]